MKRFVNIDLSCLQTVLHIFGVKMKKIKRTSNLEKLKRDIVNLEDIEIIIVPKKRLLKWFQSIENEN